MTKHSSFGLALLMSVCGGARVLVAGDQPMTQADWTQMRVEMVKKQIEKRGVRQDRVLAALRKVPRHHFVPEKVRSEAYKDTALPIGHGQTISQPYIVGVMTELLDLQGHERVLEIGTGSGYQAAVLAEMVTEIYSIEIIPELARTARDTLERLGYNQVHVKTGDGWQGWPEEAPFDAIVVTAAPKSVPEPLVQQLKEGGLLVIPLGPQHRQELVVYRKQGDHLEKRTIFPVRFVPFVRDKQGNSADAP